MDKMSNLQGIRPTEENFEAKPKSKILHFSFTFKFIQ